MVEPGALETCLPEKPSEAWNVVRTRTQRIPSRSRAPAHTKTGYICAGQNVISTFRLQQRGGPYIPDSRQYTNCQFEIILQSHCDGAKTGSLGNASAVQQAVVVNQNLLLTVSSRHLGRSLRPRVMKLPTLANTSLNGAPGVPSSGRTHWFRAIARRRFRGNVQFFSRR
jgi:hypothetical protein